jgi:hypothetical protein
MESRRCQLVLPLAVDARLEELLRQARTEGTRTSRSEIVATLVWGAAPDGDVLGVAIRDYRRSIQTTPEPSPQSHNPGPRPLTGGHSL